MHHFKLNNGPVCLFTTTEEDSLGFILPKVERAAPSSLENTVGELCIYNIVRTNFPGFAEVVLPSFTRVSIETNRKHLEKSEMITRNKRM